MDLKAANLRGGKIDGEVHIDGYDQTVTIYGDRKGLKHLAEKLLALAELDQDKTIPSQLPDSEGFHIHLDCNFSRAKTSQELVIGRIDSKGDGSVDWYAEAILDLEEE